MGLSGLFSLPVLSALPSSPPNQESEEACGEAGPRQDLTLLLPPASTEGGGYQPGITKNSRHHDNQSPASGQVLGDLGCESRGVERGPGGWNLGLPPLAGLPAMR